MTTPVTVSQPIARYRGDTWPSVITVVDATGTAINIAGCTFLLTVNSNSAPTDQSTQLMQVAGVIVSAPAGTVGFSPTAGQQSSLAAGKFWYDVQMTDGSGVITTVAFGPFVVLQDITK
jgi:hypothetical protein